VAVTYTLNDGLRQRRDGDQAGFLLNNEMDDFRGQAGRGERLWAGAG